MTQEQIEKEIEKRLDTPDNQWDSIFNSGFSRGFSQGANWRISSVWHKPEEVPKTDELLITVRNRQVAFCRIKSGEDWDKTVEFYGITTWSYFKDLRPDAKL